MDETSEEQELNQAPDQSKFTPGYVLSALRRAQTDVNRWVHLERYNYAELKFNQELRHKGVLEILSDPHLSEEGYWLPFVGNYLKRAQLAGLHTLQGRQALGKMIVTLHALLEASVVAFGGMPDPGTSSGDIRTTGKPHHLGDV